MAVQQTIETTDAPVTFKKDPQLLVEPCLAFRDTLGVGMKFGKGFRRLVEDHEIGPWN